MKPLSLFDFASLPRRASRPALLGACAAATWCHVSLASDEPRVYTDPAGDAVLRRTDPSADGLVHPDAGWPDYVRVAYGGWQTNTPVSNPYNGSWRDPRDTNLLRIDLVFHGLVNPPRPGHIKTWNYEGAEAVTLASGAEMGRFQLGSTVVMLFPSPLISWWPGGARRPARLAYQFRIGSIAARKSAFSWSVSGPSGARHSPTGIPWISQPYFSFCTNLPDSRMFMAV